MLIKLNTAWRRVGQQACFVSWMQHCRTRGGGGAAAGACAGCVFFRSFPGCGGWVCVCVCGGGGGGARRGGGGAGPPGWSMCWCTGSTGAFHGRGPGGGGTRTRGRCCIENRCAGALTVLPAAYRMGACWSASLVCGLERHFGGGGGGAGARVGVRGVQGHSVSAAGCSAAAGGRRRAENRCSGGLR